MLFTKLAAPGLLLLFSTISPILGEDTQSDNRFYPLLRYTGDRRSRALSINEVAVKNGVMIDSWPKDDPRRKHWTKHCPGVYVIKDSEGIFRHPSKSYEIRAALIIIEEEEDFNW
jgi:hypothetical protein